MEDKKYDKCPECGAPCEVVKKMDFDGNTPTIPYDEYSYHQAKQGPAWVKGAPTERKLYHARFKGHLSDDIHDGTIEPVKDPEYWQAIASGVRISIKDSHIIEYLDESGAAPLTQDRADFIREANSQDLGGEERAYGPNEYPDLSSATAEQKAETINGLVLVTAGEVMKMFYAFGLKTHIECTVINDPTREEFDFIFRKKGAAPSGERDDTLAFAEWCTINYIKVKDGGWVKDFASKDELTTAQLYDIFKQQKEK